MTKTHPPGRRSWLVGFVILGITVAAAAVGYVRWNRAVVAKPLGPSAAAIVPGIYLLGKLDPSAAYVVETSEGLVLIDSGLDSDASLLKSEMTELGLDWKRIREILLTHAHGDHCGGAEYLRKATGAKVYAGKGDAETLRSGTSREGIFSVFAMSSTPLHATSVDVELSGGEDLVFGGIHFKAIGAPGHTPGSICYLTEKNGLRVLFAGDVISMLRGDGNPHPRGLKPLGTYSAYLPPRYRGDAKDYLETLHKLRALPVPDLVLPGHPRSDQTPQNPVLTQKRWEEILDAGIRDMDTLLAHYKADGHNFLDGIPKRLLPDFYYFGDFQNQALYGFFAQGKFFVVDAPGGPGLGDFLKARQEQLGLKPSEPAVVLLTSANARDTAGLKTLIEQSHATVVAPSEGLAAIKALCPAETKVLSTEELAKTGWFSVKVMSLRGRGISPVAYVVSWMGKTVLISGRIPILFDQASMDALASDLSESRENVVEYLLSINQLETIKPDLWLPTLPSDGQNANLYETEWNHVIANNYRTAYSIMEKLEGRR